MVTKQALRATYDAFEQARQNLKDRQREVQNQMREAIEVDGMSPTALAEEMGLEFRQVLGLAQRGDKPEPLVNENSKPS